MISFNDKATIRLLARSPDCGDGWRTVSEECWILIEHIVCKELFEVDEIGKRVRMSPEGLIVLKYLV
jgi:hypothetical protein